MPILANARKALRKSQRKEVINRRVKTRLKTALDQAKKKPSTENLSGAFSTIDKAIKRNLVHKNKAARLKSQLSKLLAQ